MLGSFGLLCGNPTERGESSKLDFWPRGTLSGKKRAHKHNFLVRLPLGHTLVSPCFTQVEAQFVTETKPVCTWDKPRTKGGRKVDGLKVYVPFFAR